MPRRKKDYFFCSHIRKAEEMLRTLTWRVSQSAWCGWDSFQSNSNILHQNETLAKCGHWQGTHSLWPTWTHCCNKCSSSKDNHVHEATATDPDVPSQLRWNRWMLRNEIPPPMPIPSFGYFHVLQSRHKDYPWKDSHSFSATSQLPIVGTALLLQTSPRPICTLSSSTTRHFVTSHITDIMLISDVMTWSKSESQRLSWSEKVNRKEISMSSPHNGHFSAPTTPLTRINIF